MNPQTSYLPLLFLSLFIAACSAGDPDDPSHGMDKPMNDHSLTADSAIRFATLALDCIHREYPNKLGQVLRNENDLQPPKTLHPAFYGCFDWHSSVHGHWMLVRLLKEFPTIALREQIVAGLSESLSAENIAGEVAYLDVESASWERTYGWAWLLQLSMELERWVSDPLARQWADALRPLAAVIRSRYIEFLPRQEYAIRTGVHPNTAFGLSFALDYAVTVDDRELRDAIIDAASRYYARDNNCPLDWEPSGEDFLSPCLEEAALMARVLSPAEFPAWLDAFLPTLADPDALVPANVSDRSDPKIVHLDGLNLSRAWNLYVIAEKLGDDARVSLLHDKADEHLAASLPHITSEHYEGSHWLGSFAIYALTRRP